MFRNWNTKLNIALSLALMLAMIVTVVALADALIGDALVTSPGTSDNVNLTVPGGNTVTYEFGALISNTGGSSDNVFPGSLDVTIYRDGDWLNTPAGTPAKFIFTAYDAQQTGTISIVVPCDAEGSMKEMVAQLDAGTSSNGKSLDSNKDTVTLKYRITAGPNGDNCAAADTTPPVVTVPDDMTLEATGPSGATATFSASATDNVDGVLTPTCVPASGSTFALGTTTVTCSATDAAGNTGSASFNVTVQDTTPSVIAAHGDETAEATGPTGAVVTYTSPATSDIVDGAGTATCVPDSGSLFALGDTTVTCNASDAAGNAATSTTFVVHVVDTTPPTITFVSRTPAANGNGWNNADVTVEWSCSDLVGVVSASVSATVSTEGENQSATGTCEDTSGNKTSDTQTGINIDKTAPTASASASPAPNGNGWNNSDVTVTFSGTDGLSGIDFCDAAAVLSSEGAGQSASGTCTDKAGNVSAPATASGINIDKTAPTASASVSPAPNANGWNNTDVTVTFSGNDGIGSGIDFCDAAVVLSSEGAGQSASGTCTDKAGNVSALATVSGINIDKTAPTLTWSGGPADGAAYYFGFVPAAPTCTAADTLSGPDGCAVTGYDTTVGSHTMTATAHDKAGNAYIETRTYTVLAWTLKGFYQPVDMGANVVNTVKGGSTVPLKFEVFAGTTELTDTAIVSTLAKQVTCNATEEDTIEVLATGGTSLRYDWSSGQFIFNWQTPKLPGKCYSVTMTTQDGSSITALFKLK